jgi:hypothetical protein
MCNEAYYNVTWTVNGAITPTGGAPADYSQAFLGNKTLPWLASAAAGAAAGGAPFFAFLAPHAPHLPAQPAPWHADAPLPSYAAPRLPSFDAFAEGQSWNVAQDARTPFTAVCVDAAGERVLTSDATGALVLFDLVAQGYRRVRAMGLPASALAFNAACFGPATDLFSGDFSVSFGASVCMLVIHQICSQLYMLSALLSDFGLELLDLELNGIQLDKKLRVLLSPLLYVVLSTSLILDGVDLEGGDAGIDGRLGGLDATELVRGRGGGLDGIETLLDRGGRDTVTFHGLVRVPIVHVLAPTVAVRVERYQSCSHFFCYIWSTLYFFRN